MKSQMLGLSPISKTLLMVHAEGKILSNRAAQVLNNLVNLISLFSIIAFSRLLKPRSVIKKFYD